MTGWQLVTLLAALFNTGAILYWQNANERRLDYHYDRIRNNHTLIKELPPSVIALRTQLAEWERWRDGEWLVMMRNAAALLDEQDKDEKHPAFKELRRLKADRLRQSFFLAGRCAACADLVNLAETKHCLKCGTMFPTEMPKIGEESPAAKDPGCRPS